RDGHVTGVQTCALPICSLQEMHFFAPDFFAFTFFTFVFYPRVSASSAATSFLFCPNIRCAKRNGRIAVPRNADQKQRTEHLMIRSEERRVGKECRSGWS